MQYIKQKSTGLAVYRESPHVSTTLTEAVRHTGIAIEDLEVAEENWTNDEWASVLHNQLSYAEKRRPLYGTWEAQLDMMYHGTWQDHVAKIKRDIPKENK